jgi:hypothetical protein
VSDLREAIARAICNAGQDSDAPGYDHWECWLGEANAALAAIEAAGWQCVPKEPTKEMYEAGWWQVGTNDIYRAMLTAAPKPGGEQ